MEVRCDQCQARYRVDGARVGPKGLAMRCGKCGNTFRLQADGTVTKVLPRPPGIPTPGTATPLATRPSSASQTAVPGSESPGGTAVLQPAPQAKSEPVPKPVPSQMPGPTATAPAIPTAQAAPPGPAPSPSPIRAPTAPPATA